MTGLGLHDSRVLFILAKGIFFKWQLQEETKTR